MGITYVCNIDLGIQLPIYEYLKQHLPNTTMGIAICAFIAKLVATTLTYPIDTIRTNKRRVTNLSISEIIKKIKSEGGLIGFYKGYPMCLARSVPCSVIAFIIYERLRWTKHE